MESGEEASTPASGDTAETANPAISGNTAKNEANARQDNLWDFLKHRLLGPIKRYWLGTDSDEYGRPQSGMLQALAMGLFVEAGCCTAIVFGMVPLGLALIGLGLGILFARQLKSFFKDALSTLKRALKGNPDKSPENATKGPTLGPARQPPQDNVPVNPSISPGGLSSLDTSFNPNATPPGQTAGRGPSVAAAKRTTPAGPQIAPGYQSQSIH